MTEEKIFLVKDDKTGIANAWFKIVKDRVKSIELSKEEIEAIKEDVDFWKGCMEEEDLLRYNSRKVKIREDIFKKLENLRL